MNDLLAALAVVFLAELGDKTQLVAVGFGARHRLPPVLVGVALGYVASVSLSVVVGGLLGAALPGRVIGIAGGLLFVGFALWTLWSEREVVLGRAPSRADGAIDAGGPPDSGTDVRLIASVAGMMFLAELGDKTMLASATLAASGQPIAVWIGATVGIIAAGFVGVFVGNVLGARLPERAITIASAALFAIFGVALIALNL